MHPFFGGQFGPLTFMICVLGGLGNMVGAFVASFIMSEIISLAGVIWSTEMGYVIAFVVFIVMIFARPGGIPGPPRLSSSVARAVAARCRPGRRRWRWLPALPMAGMKQYVLHVMIQILIWAFIGGRGR